MAPLHASYEYRNIFILRSNIIKIRPGVLPPRGEGKMVTPEKLNRYLAILLDVDCLSRVVSQFLRYGHYKSCDKFRLPEKAIRET